LLIDKKIAVTVIVHPRFELSMALKLGSGCFLMYPLDLSEMHCSKSLGETSAALIKRNSSDSLFWALRATGSPSRALRRLLRLIRSSRAIRFSGNAFQPFPHLHGERLFGFVVIPFSYRFAPDELARRADRMDLN